MDRSVLLTLLKEFAASTDGVHAEVGIGGVRPNDETFLQLTSLANRDEYAIVSVDTTGWFQLDVSGGFYHAQADDLASDETVREYLEQYFQAALAYLAGHWSTRTSRLFRLPFVVVDGAVDLFGQPLALGLRVRDSWRMLSRRPPRATFSDEHSMFAPVTDEDRANFPIPLLPTVGFCRAGEYQGLYLFSNLLNLFPVAERMWDIVIAGGRPGDDELFFRETASKSQLFATSTSSGLRRTCRMLPAASCSTGSGLMYPFSIPLVGKAMATNLTLPQASPRTARGLVSSSLHKHAREGCGDSRLRMLRAGRCCRYIE
ncbi:hypothetical protein [Salinibacterium sp. M195]|uniref:hypothetical protein n=1 Tax=Salinibacterium sp. M195 TaxID=2583374 RepID=UPI001C62D3FC|nr:hypothetical protein [Salinibacterium sp. M195]QYH36914.1 hypothetical protein FFT87_13775 [Salinibacterium sp. M195]